MLVVFANIMAFFLPRVLPAISEPHNLTTSLDNAIPFIPAFIVIYVLAYFQWALNYIMIAHERRSLFRRFITAEGISRVICFLVFVIYPTTMVLGTITGGGFFNWLTNLIYSLDEPNNLLPSIHCLQSWLCFRAALAAEKVPSWYRYVSLVFTLLVVASTVLVKQHVVVDCVAGIALAELLLLVVRERKTEKVPAEA